MLLRVSDMLPDLDDGKAVKGDLIDGNNTFSLIPTVDPLDSLTFFIRHPKVKGLPLPAESTLIHLRQLWPARSEEIIQLAEQAIKKKSIFRQSILRELSELIDADSFFLVTNKLPDLRHSLIIENPTLLDSEDLLGVAQPELSRLLSLLPDSQPLVTRVIKRLVYLDDQDVVEKIFSRFPDIVIRSVVEAIERSSLTNDGAIPGVWLQVIAKSVSNFIHGDYIKNSHSMSALAIFAEVLGYKNREVLGAGPLP